MAYFWARGNGEIEESEYDRTTDTLNNEQVKDVISNALTQFGHSVTLDITDENISEIYTATIDGTKTFIIAAKGTTPGGRGLRNEQRIQQNSDYVNYIFEHSENKTPVHLGVYKRDEQVVFCAWKVKRSSAQSGTPISKQIKIETIASAMRFGYA